MKRLLLLLAITVLITNHSYSEDDSAQLGIAVMDFEAIGNVDPSLSASVREAMNSALSRSGQFTLVDRQSLDMLMDEQEMILSGLVNDPDKLSEFGQMTGADVIVTGSVSRIGGQINIIARMIDITTAEIEQTEEVTVRSENEILDGVQTIAANFAGINPMLLETETMEKQKGSLPSEFSASIIDIAEIDGKLVALISSGQRAGVFSGANLKVMMPEEGTTFSSGYQMEEYTENVGSVYVEYVGDDFSRGVFNPKSGYEDKLDEIVQANKLVSRGGLSWAIKAYANDMSLLTVEGSMLLMSKMYMGIGLGFSLTSLEEMQPLFQAFYNYGFYFIGNSASDFRLGGELSLQFALNTGNYNPDFTAMMAVGGYAVAEWKFLLARVGVVRGFASSSKFHFPISAGVAFHF